MKYLLLLLFSISSQAEWNDWHSENKELYKNLVVLNIIDVYQTHYVLNEYPSAEEKNPFLGKRPSTQKLILAKAVALYGVYSTLDGHTRHTKRRTLKTANATYMVVVINNGYIGFDLQKKF